MVRQVLNQEAAALQSMAARVDATLLPVLQQILDVRGRIIVTGVGKMGCIARKAAATFCSLGAPAIYLHAGEAAHGDLGIVTPDDLVLALSYSGWAQEVLNLIPYLHRFNIPLIAITGNLDSELAQRSHHAIDIRVDAEAEPNGLAPTASTTVAMAICDALAIAVARRRGFTAAQFALYHPGGNLGRKLLMMTAEVMHSGDAMPLASPETLLRDAISVISEKRLGAVLVVDHEMHLQGILTDGDIRRVLQKFENPLSRPIAEFMTVQAHTIASDSLAADAMQMMQAYAITVLPVVEQPIVCGVVHLHDLIKAGLA